MATNQNLVLIAIDQSDKCKSTFEWYAKNIHRPTNKVLLVHVPENATIELSKGIRLNDGEWKKLKESEKRELEEVQTSYKNLCQKVGIDYHYETVFSVKPGEGIIEKAKETKALFIVVGCRGLGTIRRTVLGSVSDYLVHHATCPVIVVH